jgi:hypothetical protein
MTAAQRISDERIAEIGRLLDEHAARHRAHEIGCGCNAYQDLIYYLPEYDPEDPCNTAIPEQVDEYVLSDGTVLDGERQGWRISRRPDMDAHSEDGEDQS